MSVRFDLTAIAPELMDAVICMDNSPAYAAFKEEIEAILADFNKKGVLSSVWKIDEKDLTSKSEETLKNMHRAFLLWSFKEEKEKGADPDCCCLTIQKLFFKSQSETITAINGGAETVACDEAKGVIEAFKEQINLNTELYGSVKEFFKGYVYGYFFSFLGEAKIMKKYAEMLAYLGVMSNKIPASVSEQQKILPKMALLLANDRFKYLNGSVPRELMMDIIFDRINFGSLSNEDGVVIRKRITDFVISNWKTDEEDEVELISDDVTASFSSAYFGSYINVPEFAEGLYRKCTAGVRTFLDGDRDDTGDYSAGKLAELIDEKCLSDRNSFFTTEKSYFNDTALGGNSLCFKYPIIFKDERDHFFAPVYEELVYPVLDKQMYERVSDDAIPSGVFPFVDKAFNTNCIRAAAGIADSSLSVRKDKLPILERLGRISMDFSVSGESRKMLMLEQILYLVSGNCGEEKYKELIRENVFGTGLYEEYVRYRTELLVSKALAGLDEKKKLLDDLNRIG